MYIEKVFVYLTLILLLLVVLRMWRNEVRLYKTEKALRFIVKHEKDTDKTLRIIIEIIDKLFKGLLEGAKKREAEDEQRRKETV